MCWAGRFCSMRGRISDSFSGSFRIRKMTALQKLYRKPWTVAEKVFFYSIHYKVTKRISVVNTQTLWWSKYDKCVLTSTAGSAMTTPILNKNLIGRTRTENWAARGGALLEQVLCKKNKKQNNTNNSNKKKTTWNYHIERYDDNLNNELTMYAHTILVLAYFANIV